MSEWDIVGFVEPVYELRRRQAESLLDFLLTWRSSETQVESSFKVHSTVWLSETQIESLLKARSDTLLEQKVTKLEYFPTFKAACSKVKFNN